VLPSGAPDMKPKVYIDGEAGTTGLRIRKLLAERTELEVLRIPDALRKDESARRELVLASDVTILCLPDAASREVAGWVKDASTRLIDASTAHRVADGWVYGMPELTPSQRTAIASAKYVSNPGCYAGSFILLARPLIDAGVISPDVSLAVHALSGYSGGGKSLIERWENPDSGLASLPFEAPYALGRVHKHVPEMMSHGGLRVEPYFVPSVGPFFNGMRVQVQLPVTSLERGATGEDAWRALTDRYRGEPFVRVMPLRTGDDGDERVFDPRACNDTNRIELHVVAHPSRHVLLVAISDNLGKGASGTAVQSLNLMLEMPETAGLSGSN
jgi:N-acetyl-gamma-glutamyl-phosphate reductase